MVVGNSADSAMSNAAKHLDSRHLVSQALSCSLFRHRPSGSEFHSLNILGKLISFSESLGHNYFGSLSLLE